MSGRCVTPRLLWSVAQAADQLGDTEPYQDDTTHHATDGRSDNAERQVVGPRLRERPHSEGDAQARPEQDAPDDEGEAPVCSPSYPF